MTPAAFLASYPEFASPGTDPTLIAAKLAQAAAEMGGPDVTVWGGFAPPAPAGTPQPQTLADVAHGALTADLLITSPFGTSMGLKSNDGPSAYRKKFDDLLEAVAGGFIVAGGAPGPCQAPASAPPALVFVAGSGSAALTNGSTAVTFTAPQTLPAGALLAFGSQPGAYYSVALNVTGATSCTLAAPYTGTTTSSTSWVHT